MKSAVAGVLRSWRRVDYRALAVALVLGTLGGALFAWARMPLAWMIGAMAATCAAALARLPVEVPPGLRSGMVIVLGIMLGSAFRPDILGQLDEWALTLSCLILYILASLAAGMIYLRLVARYDPVTAFFTAAPGGLSEMVIVGHAMGGDERTIALSHSARIMLVVLTVPIWFRLTGEYVPGGTGSLGPAFGDVPPFDYLLLAACVIGAPVAQAMRIPAGSLVGPMLLSAAIHLAGLTAGKPPGVLIAAAQVVVGAAIGARFVGVTLRRMGRIAVTAAGLTVILLAIDAALAVGLHALTGIGIVDLVLAYAPGGLAEMSLVALALGIDAAFVSTHHVVRILLIVTFAPVVFRLLRPRLAPPKPPST